MLPWYPPKRNYISSLIESEAWNPSWTSRLPRDQCAQKTHSSGSWMPPTVHLWSYSKEYMQQSCIMPWQAFVSTEVPRDEALLISSLIQAGREAACLLACPAFKPFPASLLHWLCQGWWLWFWGADLTGSSSLSYTKTHIILLLPSVLRVK